MAKIPTGWEKPQDGCWLAELWPMGGREARRLAATEAI